MDALRAYGGVSGLARALGTDTTSGLAHDPAVVAEHSRVYGPNTFKERPCKNFFVLCWENLQDPIILLLCAAALVSTVLGAAIPQQRAEGEWVEGIAIWVAVLLVIGVGESRGERAEERERGLVGLLSRRGKGRRGCSTRGGRGRSLSFCARAQVLDPPPNRENTNN